MPSEDMEPWCDHCSESLQDCTCRKERAMSSPAKPEAWEVLCPELPPGKQWVRQPEDERHGTGWDIMFTRSNGAMVMVCNGSYHSETREYHAAKAWELFADETGITKKQHAESIAIPLVREAAEAHCKARGIELEGVIVGDHRGFWFHLVFNDGERMAWGKSYPPREDAPDLCTAALAAIDALSPTTGEGGG